jgi:hypothetical protein
MTMSKQDMHSVVNCENCATPLQGDYCHACGQSVHNPTRHFGHAVEEVLESFWHLDGRAFRTLRDLMVPGRIARNYLAGQRVRYIAPLRLFVILSLLTFFIGKLVVHVDGQPIQFGGEGGAAIGKAQTVAEVEQIEARLLKELSVAEKESAKVPGVNAALIAARARIQGEAASRIAELKDEAEASKPATTTATPVPAPAHDEGPNSGLVNPDGKPWDAKTNPVKIAWLPGFANDWLNRKIGRAQDNLKHMEGNTDKFVQAALGAVPTALFLLMPVFALLLKVLYLGSGRHYLQHMVVALYSHAWLLLMLLAMFVLNGVKDGLATTWAVVVTSLVSALLWLWIPVYLFLMQHRVYGDHWAITAIRYCVIGSIYMFLVLFVVLFALFAGIVA